MGANNTFVTGIGGFATGEAGADGYQGAAGQLPGAGEMTASVMFMTRPNYSASETGALFGNIPTGGTSGWALAMAAPSTESVEVSAIASDDTAGTVSVAAGSEGVLSNVHIATLRLSVAAGGGNGALDIYLDGIKASVAFDTPGDPVYVPSVEAPTVGFSGSAAPAAQFNSGYILGCAYAETRFSDQQIWRHQMMSLEAGDIVDGSQGQGFGAGAPTFTNLWSARRTNAARSVPASSFIAGLQDGLTVGQVPPAAAIWLPSSGPISLPLRDDGVSSGGPFVTGLRALY